MEAAMPDTREFLTKLMRMSWNCLPSKHRVPLMRAFIHQADPDEQRSIGVISLGSALSQLQRNGLTPNAVIDVGANRGNWTREAHRIFPSASFFLAEADPENSGSLQKVCSEFPNCAYCIALLGAESRQDVRFYQMGTGSSVLPERTAMDRNVLKLPMTTLDDLVAEKANETVLLKLDVQGYELEVLRGATQVLSKAEVVILECSLIQYNDDAPLFAEVVAFMNDRGFVTYDFCGQAWRSPDGALFQVDLVFVKESSRLRKPFEKWNSNGHH
jgi:FkbM family methyltransferase